MDGLDLALCRFTPNGPHWEHVIMEARTVAYPADMQERLLQGMGSSALDAARLHRDLGRFIGSQCATLLAGRSVDVIGSHGHTLFHRPEEDLTTQIGCGARIAAHSGMPVVCDLRTKDIALGGQGAPLVPLGERLLFPTHRAFLNIGGICNVSLHHPERVLGHDVCIGNQAMNALAAMVGRPYDAEGALARSGRILSELLARLDALPFHDQAPPRSLGREWFLEQMLPMISEGDVSVADRLRTVVEHVAGQVGRALEGTKGPVLVTGGGAHNAFLLERIEAHATAELEVPDKRTVDQKEALIFAFLGLLRLLERPNVLASVTGARQDSIGGALYLPN